MPSYKLASMFVPATATLYNNTKITMVIFAVFAILILVRDATWDSQRFVPAKDRW